MDGGQIRLPKYEHFLFEDVRQAVDNDDYIWGVIWGPPRCSKTTLLGWILYSIYKDWYKVLTAFVFNLPQLMHKMKQGLPERWWTRNKLHNRVPVLGYDDYGVSSNKAVTQHEEAWDIFKGGFDALGTKIGVLYATMVDPTEPTFQLMKKYTHEVQIVSRGVYKYDKVHWKQHYKGWDVKVTKECIEYGEYDLLPDWVYKEYNEMRMELADEVLVRIEDAISLNQLQFCLQVLKPIDFQVLQLISDRGPTYYYKITDLGSKDEMRLSLVRLKARGLVVPLRSKTSTTYRYDMTWFGKDILEAWLKGEAPSQPSPSKAKVEPV